MHRPARWRVLSYKWPLPTRASSSLVLSKQLVAHTRSPHDASWPTWQGGRRHVGGAKDARARLAAVLLAPV